MPIIFQNKLFGHFSFIRIVVFMRIFYFLLLKLWDISNVVESWLLRKSEAIIVCGVNFRRKYSIESRTLASGIRLFLKCISAGLIKSFTSKNIQEILKFCQC